MDLDGTLIHHDGTLAAADLQAMRDASASGIALAIVTGRRKSTFRQVRDRLDDVVFRTAVSNGAVLLRLDNETVESAHDIPWSSVLDAWRIAQDGHIDSCIAVTLPGDLAPLETETPDAMILTSDGAFYNVDAPCEPELQRIDARCEVAPAEALSRRLVHATFHVGDVAVAKRLARQLVQCLKETVSVFIMTPPRAKGVLVEIVVKGGKGVAVRHLARSLGIERTAIGAIGDAPNDELLLAAAHHRYAVGGSALALVAPGAIEVGEREAVADALCRFACAFHRPVER